MCDAREVDVLVIGGGLFGCLSAIEVSRKGFNVRLLEKNSSLMNAASSNNQNRLHLGYHYPRDLETAVQCQRGFKAFTDRYANSILGHFTNAYFISSDRSKVTFSEYIEFCQNANLPINTINLKRFEVPIHNVEGGLFTNEVVYDTHVVKDQVLEELAANNVNYECSSLVESVEESDKGFIAHTSNGKIRSRAIVNCTYANVNSFNKHLGLAELNLQYELTIIPVIRWRNGKPPIGITVMDGEFFSIMPFGKSNKYLLYHVNYAVRQTVIGSAYPEHWMHPKSAVEENEARQAFSDMVNASCYWLPDLRDAEYVDYLATVRVVLVDTSDTDRRPSLIEKMATTSPFYNILSGKINHSLWVSSELASALQRDLQ
jgi:glycine/D-amino acid oxidase-like deaminating enzyme